MMYYLLEAFGNRGVDHDENKVILEWVCVYTKPMQNRVPRNVFMCILTSY